jgi:hypothetical protein
MQDADILITTPEEYTHLMISACALRSHLVRHASSMGVSESSVSRNLGQSNLRVTKEGQLKMRTSELPLLDAPHGGGCPGKPVDVLGKASRT